ncbi:hypothetical protein AKJ53_01435 [candidate division MSBL1 archaeon SCGC-AAA382F02]|uniref:DUF438 domain-containing protein n=1 Tax=candidate division MSBL1 archaeon SCGC-AAA382F02 TaxID=1698282 RepID=A0A133VI14_9EURY|nr:hypothetical protein AKJ53_01435 [candidate division MSBL1 archaeon SCGC-AAA382F02]
MSPKNDLKELLKKVKSTEDIESIKPEIKEKLKGVNATDLPQAEQELVEEEEIDVDELRKVCEPYIELMRKEPEEKTLSLNSEHLIEILKSEHEVMLYQLKMEKSETFDHKAYQVDERGPREFEAHLLKKFEGGD